MTEVSSTTSSGLSSTTASSVEALSANYELFLSVLTTQMENQNPLDPTDADEMTNQLIQYSSVEQQILSNQYLEALVQSTNNQSASVALDLVGMEVTYAGETLDYEDGETLKWAYEIPDDVSTITAEITNEDGDVIYTKKLDTTAGEYAFEWSGELDSGGSASDGEYTLSFYAEDSEGEEVEIQPQTTSKCVQVDWSTGTAQLIMDNGMTVDLSDVVSATEADSSTTTS